MHLTDQGDALLSILELFTPPLVSIAVLVQALVLPPLSTASLPPSLLELLSHQAYCMTSVCEGDGGRGEEKRGGEVSM